MITPLYLSIDAFFRFYDSLSRQIATTSCFMFISNANGVYKRNYSFRMNIVRNLLEAVKKFVGVT